MPAPGSMVILHQGIKSRSTVAHWKALFIDSVKKLNLECIDASLTLFYPGSGKTKKGLYFAKTFVTC